MFFCIPCRYRKVGYSILAWIVLSVSTNLLLSFAVRKSGRRLAFEDLAAAEDPYTVRLVIVIGE